jgi:HD-like signal output (HDOD) protein
MDSSRVLVRDENDTRLQTAQTAMLDVTDTRIRRLRESEVQATLRKVKSLATLPAIAHKIMGLLEDPEVRVDKVSQIIEADPQISTQMLRLVNSAFFGLRGKVKTIRMAVVTLGLNGIRQMMVTSTLIDMFKSCQAEAAKKLFRHGVLAGQWSREVARMMGQSHTAEDVFVAGLIHELGELLLLQYFPETAEQLALLAAEGRDAREIELELLGVTHSDMGAYVASIWNFSPSLMQSIHHHHAPPIVLRVKKNLDPQAVAVHAGCTLADASERASKNTLVLDEDFLSVHNLQKERLEALLGPILRETTAISAQLLG